MQLDLKHCARLFLLPLLGLLTLLGQEGAFPAAQAFICSISLPAGKRASPTRRPPLKHSNRTLAKRTHMDRENSSHNSKKLQEAGKQVG